MADTPSTATAVTTEHHQGTTHVVFRSPILEIEVLEQLAATLEELGAAYPAQPLVLRSAHPTVFLAGAHLGEIAALDATSCVPYAGRGRKVVRLLIEYPAPTVAAVFGSCSGGGFDIALACDIVVSGPSASFEHPGVNRGLVTGWSGTTTLPERVGKSSSRAAILTGEAVGGRSLAAAGPHSQTEDDPLEMATGAALRLTRLDPARWQLWRTLRQGRFVDRFRASVLHKL